MIEPKPIKRPWQPRFTILGMMLWTLVISVAAAGVGYLVRSERSGGLGQMLFVGIMVAGPLILAVVVSAARAIILYATRPPKKRRKVGPHP
jgi:hypothetical protein